MHCRNCQQLLQPGANVCENCHTERQVFCIHCGGVLQATESYCGSCQKPQFGQEAIGAALPRYTHPQRIFNIAVPPPWEVAERKLLNAPYTMLNRSDVRAKGIKGMAQGVMGVGPASLQIWLLNVRPGSNLYTLNQVYSQIQAQLMTQSSGGGQQGAAAAVGVLALTGAMAKPFQQVAFNLGGVDGLILDYKRSVLGFAKTIERRFLTLANYPGVTIGAVMIQSGSEAELAEWGQPLFAIATSFRFGPVPTPAPQPQPAIGQPNPVIAPMPAQVATGSDSQAIRARLAEALTHNSDEATTMGLMQQLFEAESRDGNIAPEREAALRAVLPEATHLMTEQPQDTMSAIANIAQVRQLMDRVSDAVLDPSFDSPGPASGSRPAHVVELFKRTETYVLAEATRANKSEGENDAIAKLQARCVSLKQDIRGLKSEQEANSLEWEALRRLATDVRNYSLRNHLTIANPFWPSPPLPVEVNGVFMAGDEKVAGMVLNACQVRGLKLFSDVPNKDYAQNRWDQIRSCGVAVFDITRYLNKRAEMSDDDRARVGAICYEMGIAMTLGKSVVIVGRKLNGEEQRPFDVDIQPVWLTGDDSKDSAAVIDAIDNAIYGQQRGGAESSVGRSIQCVRELLESSPNSIAQRAVNLLTNDLVADPIGAGLVLRQVLGFLGPDSPQMIFPAFPGVYSKSGAKEVFHVMEFGEHTETAHRVTKEACEAAHVKYVRGDTNLTPNVIRSVWDGIGNASHIVVDMTRFNPNVTFELGIAQTLGRKVLMIRRDALSYRYFPNIFRIRMNDYSNSVGNKVDTDPSLPMSDEGIRKLKDKVAEFVNE